MCHEHVENVKNTVIMARVSQTRLCPAGIVSAESNALEF